jgi:hypothetical protein
MGFFFKTAEEIYNQDISKLRKLQEQIAFHQARANKFLQNKNLKDLARAGADAKAAQGLISEAKAVAGELRKVCGKLNRPLPGAARMLLAEEAREKKLKNTARREGVRA